MMIAPGDVRTTAVFWCMTGRAASTALKRFSTKAVLDHLIRRCREMIQVASAAAARFPLAVQELLQQGLQLRDRYQQGSLSEHGLAVATGRLEALMDRLLDRHFGCPANQRLAKHLRHEQPIFSPFYAAPVWRPPTIGPSRPSGRW
jgi:hypothetical protein